MNNIKKNVLCGVIYLNSDKIMLVDKQNGLLIRNENIHSTLMIRFLLTVGFI